MPKTFELKLIEYAFVCCLAQAENLITSIYPLAEASGNLRAKLASLGIIPAYFKGEAGGNLKVNCKKQKLRL